MTSHLLQTSVRVKGVIQGYTVCSPVSFPPGSLDPFLHIDEEPGKSFSWSMNTRIVAMLWVLH